MNDYGTIAERVERGLTAILTHGEALGVDLSRVDLSKLSMLSSTDCVLGQAKPGAWWANTASELALASGEAVEMAHRTDAARKYGFASDITDDHEYDVREAEALRDEWRRQITEHRESVTV